MCIDTVKLQASLSGYPVLPVVTLVRLHYLTKEYAEFQDRIGKYKDSCATWCKFYKVRQAMRKMGLDPDVFCLTK